MKYFKLISRLFLLCFIALTACEKSTPERSSLKVHITGTLSGKDRPGIKVNVYKTETDAKNKINSLGEGWTDNQGATYYDISGLKPDSIYWVLAEAKFSQNIEHTNPLKAGSNTFGMTVL